MRILFISTTFPDASSPTRGTYNTALVQALAEKHEVEVISCRAFSEVYSPKTGRKKFVADPTIQRLGIKVHFPTYWYTPKVLQNFYGDQMWWSLNKTVKQVIAGFQPDAVLSYWAHPDGDVGRRTAQLAQIPSAVIVGGTDILILPHLPGRGKRVREVLDQTDAILTVSHGLAAKTIELGVAPEKVHPFSQGVDRDLIESSSSRESARQKLGLDPALAHLLWVGRVVQIKAIPILLQAALILKQQALKFQLHLLGEGPLLPALREKAAQLGLNDVVKFHGGVGHDRIGDWYRAADLSVLSSTSEGLPNVLRESLACGTPFVSTDVGSVKEICHPEASRLVPVNDAPKFAEAIQQMLNPEAKLAAALYQPTTWQESAAAVVKIFEALPHTANISSPQANATNLCMSGETA